MDPPRRHDAAARRLEPVTAVASDRSSQAWKGFVGSPLRWPWPTIHCLHPAHILFFSYVRRSALPRSSDANDVLGKMTYAKGKVIRIQLSVSATTRAADQL